MLINSQQQQQDSHWQCNRCHKSITQRGTIRYVNTDVKDFDLCEDCYSWCWEQYKSRNCPSVIEEETNTNNDEENQRENDLIFEIFCRDLKFIIPTKFHYSEMKGRIKSSDRLNGSLFRSFVEYSLNPCFGVLKQDDESYHYLTYEQVFHLICCISIGLSLILKPLKRPFVSICGRNNLNWYLSDYACFFKGFVIAPIHFAQSFEETKYCIELTESQLVICTEEMLDLFIGIAKELDIVKFIIVMDGKESKECFKNQRGTQVIEILTMNEIISNGKSVLCDYLNEKNKPRENPYPEHFENHETILITPHQDKYDPRKMWIGMEHEEFILNRLDNEEDIVTLIFTSGSTGTPKGIMVSDRALRKEVLSLRLKDPKVRFSFCPLAHMSDRKYTLLAMCNGARVGIFTRDFVHIFEDIQKCKPVVIASTPRLFNVLYDEFKKVFELERIRCNSENGNTETEKEIEERVMLNFEYMLGGRMQSIILGGASSSPRLREFLAKCFHCRVTDGFGMSEAGGIMNNNRLNTTVEYKLIDVPDMNYFTTDKPHPRGELCVKTNHMFTGYYKNEELTNNAMDENGWLHTNDIVEELGPRQIRIIDRLKNIFKLSQGEFIAPAKIEDALCTSKFIFQAFIYGNVMKSYLVGVIVPNKTVLKQFAIKEGLIKQSNDHHDCLNEEEMELLATNDLIKKILCESIEKVAFNCSLLPYEVPKDFIIEFEPFSERNDLLTSSMKIKRFGCEMKYKGRLEALYEHVDQKYETMNEDLIRQLLVNSASGSDETNGNMKIIDSLHAVKFSGIMKQKFNIDIPLSLIFSQTDRNVESLVSRVSNFVSKRKTNDHQSYDWKKDIILPQEFMDEISEITSKGKVKFQKISNLRKGILLTGSTGFLGAFLLRDLLELLQTANENVKIYCLVRDTKQPNDYFDRLKKHLENFKLWKDIYGNRIRMIRGNLQDENLGLSNEDFSKLAGDIDIIYHNGAYVNSVMSYPQLFSSNTGSTFYLLKLACLSSKLNISNGDLILTPIVFISTVGVVQSGLSEFGLVPEISQGNSQNCKEMIYTHYNQVIGQLRPIIEKSAGYNSTKFVAEQYIQQSRLFGNPAVIFRPGMIGSDTVNGVSNLEDWVNRLIMGCFELGLFPKTEKSLNVLPVDIISRVIVGLTQDENVFVNSSSYSIYELANLTQYEIQIDDLLAVSATTHAKLLNEKPMEMVTYKQWKQILNERIISNKKENEMLLKLKTLFKSDTEFLKSVNKLQDNHIQKVIEIISKSENLNSIEDLIPYKNINQNYLEKQVKFLIQSKKRINE